MPEPIAVPIAKPTKITIYADFNCPFCYVLNEQLLSQGLEQQLEWSLIEHDPHANFHMTDPGNKDELADEVRRVRQRAPEVVISLPEGRANSGPAINTMAKAIAADPSRAASLRGLIYRAYWIEGKDIGHPNVLAELVQLSGFSDILTAAEQPQQVQRWQRAWEDGPFDQRIPSLEDPDSQRRFLGLPTPKDFQLFYTKHLLDSHETDDVCIKDRRPHVLIADGKVTDTERLSEALSQYFQISCCANGQQVLNLCQGSTAPDLVLMNEHLPFVDGFNACQQLKNMDKTRNTPVLLMTDQHCEDNEIRALALGAADYLRKSVSAVILTARINTHIKLKRLTETLEIRANYDSLTGLYNRREFEHLLEQEWRRSCRSHSPLSVLFIDVDFFKRYNDTYGHLAGDQCLREIAQSLQQTLSRSGEFVARYGGEEFVALLPQTPSETAFEGAGRVMQRIKELAIPHQKSDVDQCVSLSIGVATLVPNLDDSPQELLDAADQQLYQVKHHGRNGVASITLN